MKKITLELAYINTVKALHIYLQYMLNLPEYYGRNLDALYDCLTEMDEELLILVRTQGACGECTAYLPGLRHVMEDAALENRVLRIEFA